MADNPLVGSGTAETPQANEELKILHALAAGRHPFTDILLPEDSCYQSTKVLRALLSGIKALEKMSRANGFPPKAGVAWSTEEDAELVKHFDQNMSISDLARRHQRTTGAIRSRLEKLGKIKIQPAADSDYTNTRPLE